MVAGYCALGCCRGKHVINQMNQAQETNKETRKDLKCKFWVPILVPRGPKWMPRLEQKQKIDIFCFCSKFGPHFGHNDAQKKSRSTNLSPNFGTKGPKMEAKIKAKAKDRYLLLLLKFWTPFWTQKRPKTKPKHEFRCQFWYQGAQKGSQD